MVFAMSTSYMVVVLAGILAVSFVAFQLLSRRRALKRGPVWAGGLRDLWPSMTYTATGFSNPVRVIFDAVLQPASVEDSTEAVAQHFRTAIIPTAPNIDSLRGSQIRESLTRCWLLKEEQHRWVQRLRSDGLI